MAAEQVNAVREMKTHRPFVPFRIVTSSGERYEVRDRFQFAVSDTQRVLCYLLPELKRYVELSAEQIVGVERLQEKPAA